MSLAPGLFLDFGGIEQRGNQRCRADAHGDAGLDQLGAPLIVGAVVFVVAHVPVSMRSLLYWEAA